MPYTRPKIHPLNPRCPIQSQLQPVLGVRSSYIERKNVYNYIVVRLESASDVTRLSFLCQVGDIVICTCKISEG